MPLVKRLISSAEVTRDVGSGSIDSFAYNSVHAQLATSNQYGIIGGLNKLTWVLILCLGIVACICFSALSFNYLEESVRRRIQLEEYHAVRRLRQIAEDIKRGHQTIDFVKGSTSSRRILEVPEPFAENSALTTFDDKIEGQSEVSSTSRKQERSSILRIEGNVASMKASSTHQISLAVDVSHGNIRSKKGSRSDGDEDWPGNMPTIASKQDLPSIDTPGRHNANHDSTLQNEFLFPAHPKTPPCETHAPVCEGLCKSVNSFAQSRRNLLQADVENGLSRNLQSVLEFFKCRNATRIVEVGSSSGFGATAQYILKHYLKDITEYHVVDPFVVGKGMMRIFRGSTPKATAEQISKAWADSLGTAFGIDGEFLDQGMQPAGCKLRIHRLKSKDAAMLFGEDSVDIVLIDGLRTYQETVDHLQTWIPILHTGGALIVRGFDTYDGVARALLEEANRRGITLRSINQNHVVLVTVESCSAWNTSIYAHDRFEKIGEAVDLAGPAEIVKNIWLSADPTIPAGIIPSPRCAKNKDKIISFCTDSIVNPTVPVCMKHDVEVSPTRESNLESAIDEFSLCKTLWFAGFHEGQSACTPGTEGGFGYAVDYSAALSSAIANAGEALQPVLMLGRFGLENENSGELSSIGKWAEANGAKVIVLPRLSFQSSIALSQYGLPDAIYHQHAMGPFMRLDIPLVVEQHKLFDDPGICQQHVLYTDSDVIFANPVTRSDIEFLKEELRSSEGAIVAYGREYETHAEIVNTGVMMIDVPAFRKEWPAILNHAAALESFPLHDQEMLNSYFSGTEELNKKRLLLPIHWNWKSYWRLQPSTAYDIKILHFHGPKPGKTLEEIASCNIGSMGDLLRDYPDYRPHILQGICCDFGKTANWAVHLFHRFKAPMSDICGAV